MILPSLARCGPVLVAQKIVNELKDKVHFTVFYFDATVEVDMPVPSIQISFTKKINVREFDVVHCHMLRPDLYVWYHRLYKQIPVLSTLHQYIHESLNFTYGKLIASLFTPIWRRALSKMHAIACINQHMAKHYQSLGSKESVFEIYNGLEPYSAMPVKEHEQLAEIKRNFTLVGNVALLVKRKGLAQLVHSLVMNSKRFLVLVGEGPERLPLELLAQELGVADRMLITGFKENARDYLPYLDVFVMPSYSEGFGLALVEAVAANIPVVASNIESFKEMFDPKEICFFELDDTESLNQAIFQANTEKDHLIPLAYQKYMAKFTSKQMGDKYFSSYLNIHLTANEGLK